MDAGEFWTQTRNGKFGLQDVTPFASRPQQSSAQLEQCHEMMTSNNNILTINHYHDNHASSSCTSNNSNPADSNLSPCHRQYHHEHQNIIDKNTHHHQLIVNAAEAAVHLSSAVGKTNELEDLRVESAKSELDSVTQRVLTPINNQKNKNNNHADCLYSTKESSQHLDNEQYHFIQHQQKYHAMKFEHSLNSLNKTQPVSIEHFTFQQSQSIVKEINKQTNTNQKKQLVDNTEVLLYNDQNPISLTHNYHNLQHSELKQLTVDCVHMQQEQQKVDYATTPPLSSAYAAGSDSIINDLSPPPTSSNSHSNNSSTPDLKFNNENNNKLCGDLQIQLSRSSSAAAFSERTLEECWSTLQRLFMHKSAMQQMQQQIPRVDFGGTSVIGSNNDLKPHQCQQCMKSFSSNHQLVQHIRVHTGEKPYKCSYCDRRFKQLSHVQQHTRLHTGERPYKCHLPNCGRAFIQLSNLQQHLRNHDAQVERAKNRPFHCNICGKSFATESSLRTHTSKELQLHLGVLQQHASLISGPNATACPICNNLFLGNTALMEHMKHVHKEHSQFHMEACFTDIVNGTTSNLANSISRDITDVDSVSVIPSNSDNLCDTTICLQSRGSSPTELNDLFLTKARLASHICPVCSKNYINVGSLRKHLTCHSETINLTSGLRMWPCSVCQAIFTQKNGLLTHMEHMRMDPKHQFAAQYVLSRAVAKNRKRDSLLATAIAGIKKSFVM